MGREKNHSCTFCKDMKHLMNFTDVADVSKQTNSKVYAKISIQIPGNGLDKLQHT